MAPPKRKSGGRVTPKGTRPGDKVTSASSSTTSKSSTSSDEWSSGEEGGKPASSRRTTTASSRYTPPTPEEMKHSAPWVPYVMLILLGLGALMIMVRYLAFDSNWPTLIGLVFILGGLYTATKWR